MSAGGLLFALSAVNAISAIGQGYTQKAESNFNASLYEGKANLIQTQADIEKGQYESAKSKVMSTSIANIGAGGIKPTGSALAVMLETQKQMNIDQAIGQFNYQQQKNLATAEAGQYKRQGKYAVQSGYSSAFSEILQGASNYAMYKGMGQKEVTKVIKPGKPLPPTSRTFDSNFEIPKYSGSR